MNGNNASRQSGFVLPIVVACFVVVAIITTGVMSYVNYGARAGGVYMATSRCRLAAQTALERSKLDIRNAFRSHYKAYPSLLDAPNWFRSYSLTSIGSGSYACRLMQGASVGGCDVSVTVQGVETSASGAMRQFAHVTLQAKASASTPAGLASEVTIEEIVDYSMRRSTVFDYAYFVNNYGWFMGNGVTANGDIRANGNMSLDNYSYVNGFAYAAPNADLGAAGYITVTGGGMTRYQTRGDYWASAGTQTRPTNPSADSSDTVWAMGYEAVSGLYSYQETLDMPYLGDLAGYRDVANNMGGTIKQNGKVLVSGVYSDAGPSGLAGGVDKGCLVLDGTSKPIEINGPVVVNGDVIIKGTVKGQGAIYAGRNIHIVGNVVYDKPPAWPKPDSNPSQTMKSNAGKDMLGLVAKGNIVLGKYTDSSWLSSIKSYISPPFVKPYACDSSDASIGYPSTFSGDYTASDSGQKVTYTYDAKTKTYKPTGVAARKYYESAVGDKIITDYASASGISQIDAVLYNNHGVMGKIDKCNFNGALISRDEGCMYSSWVRFNWDIRLGSRSQDGINFFIYLPMSVGDARVIGWREVVL